MALLGGGGLLVLAAQSNTEKPAKRMSDNTTSLLAQNNNVLTQSSDAFGAKELFFKTMFAILLVVVLGAAAIYASRKILPKIANLPGKEIRIVETAHLGPRKAVHLVKIGEQQLLIGSTNENITTLAHITDAWTHMPHQETDNDVKK